MDITIQFDKFTKIKESVRTYKTKNTKDNNLHLDPQVIFNEEQKNNHGYCSII